MSERLSLFFMFIIITIVVNCFFITTQSIRWEEQRSSLAYTVQGFTAEAGAVRGNGFTRPCPRLSQYYATLVGSTPTWIFLC